MHWFVKNSFLTGSKIMDRKKLRKAQLIMLEMLIEVDRICQKQKIQYWLDSGTLLGAIRHKGFLVWDDDIDISMKIEDYHKFCEVAKSELPNGMSLQTSKTETSFPYDYAKVRSNKGRIIEKHQTGKDITYNQGIFIDILPCIAVKNNIFYKYSYWTTFLFIKLFSYRYLNIRYIREFVISLGDSFHVGWSHKDTKVVRSGRLPSFYMDIDIISIFPLKKITFENREFWAPNNCDDYLKVYYGDNYITPPPENKRRAHASRIEIYE